MKYCISYLGSWINMCIFCTYQFLFNFKLYNAFLRIIRKLVRKRTQFNATNTPEHQHILNIP
ncbi:hypothetical protein Hanom_Chr00s176686g01830731 [Helianthus anomalus]